MRVGLDGLLAAEGVAQIQAQLRGSQQESSGLILQLGDPADALDLVSAGMVLARPGCITPLHNLLASASETVGRLTLEVAALEG